MVKEAAILSTCNRTEVYFHGGAPEPVTRWLESTRNLPPATLAPYLYTLDADRAVSHAFRVASGLDSMVLGEPQILGQMKQAVRAADAAGSLGLVLNRLFQRTFAVAKDVRTNTDIGSASISMAAAAVKLAERIFPSLSDQRLLLVGAGEMIELAATHFAAPQAAVDHRRQPHARARQSTRGPLRRRRDHADGSQRTARAVRRHRHVHGEHAADHRQGNARARRQAAAARAGAHRRPRRAARRRARGGDARRRVSLQRRRPVRDRQGQPADPPRGRRAGRADDRRARRRISCAGCAAAASCRRSPRCRRTTMRCAVRSSSARSGCWPSGTPPADVLDALARGLTNKLLHPSLAALNAAGEAERAELIALFSRIYGFADPSEHRVRAVAPRPGRCRAASGRRRPVEASAASPVDRARTAGTFAIPPTSDSA